MSTDIEQFDVERHRAGFEAWANKQGLTASERQTRWEGWAAAKREASTEQQKDDAKDAARLDWLIKEECLVREVNGWYSVRVVTEAHPISKEYLSARLAIDAAIAHTKAQEGK